MTRKLIDTHFHFTDEPYFTNQQRTLINLKFAGVVNIISPSYNMESCHKNYNLKRLYPDLLVAYGIHPLFLPFDIAEIENLLITGNPSAVGEIGLDARNTTSSNSAQIDAFELQLNLAKTLKLPVIIHSVKRHAETLALLKKYLGLKGVIHRPSENWENMVRYTDLGYHVGLGSDLLHDGYKKVKTVAKKLPSRQILLETDLPYVPEFKKDPFGLMNYDDIVHVLSNLRQVKTSALIDQLWENTAALFNVKVN
ncbi:TatD family hydrolase [bacterium]|nr:TatD family hydrolase [candidate division CSSED10-310 bacterium]